MTPKVKRQMLCFIQSVRYLTEPTMPLSFIHFIFKSLELVRHSDLPSRPVRDTPSTAITQPSADLFASRPFLT